MFSDHRGRSGWTMCPCILQLGCMGTFVSRSKRFIQASRVAGGDMDVPLATIRLRGLSLPGNVPRRGAPVGPRTEEPDEPSYFMEQAVSKRTAHGAKPTLAELSGVRPADGADDMERPKRDRPRLAFRPFHALVAILALSCALCASLTMLVQQAMHSNRAIAGAIKATTITADWTGGSSTGSAANSDDTGTAGAAS